ncbi:MAG: (2Fe-2S)-binding protein [Planctomycetes bacterium]|nr:(2Fe-2S)-binding protein [Planctomycetota bacterium]
MTTPESTGKPTVKIQLNGSEVEADPSQPLIRACHDHGVDVPMYCYHPGLHPVGSCRICQVEVKQGEAPPRVVAACRTSVAPGMVVDTESPKAHETRRECLEFLLKNHPLDCPICDKAGECDLQDYAFQEGQGEGRSSEPRRKLHKRRSLGDVIVLDEERCILCSRCVRFFEDVTGTAQLAVTGLGARSVIDTFMGRPLTGNYQGNVADICPVGALTLKRFRFQARVWNLTKTVSHCAECSRGCAITVEVLRRKQVKRFRPRFDPNVNQYWMCDTGRFAFDHVEIPACEPGELTGGRLTDAVQRGAHGVAGQGVAGSGVGARGLEAVDVDRALGRAADALTGAAARAIVLSPFVTQEEAGAALELARTLGAEVCFVSPPPNGLQDDLLHTGDPCPNRKGLETLGVPGLGADDVRARLAKAGVAVLVGERVQELIGLERLAALTGGVRLIVLDLVAHDLPGLEVALGVPCHVEKQGHWLNVDGLRRDLAIARSAPAGVEPLTRLLGQLAGAVGRPAGATAEVRR